jgi:hypothetical protein
MNRDNIKREAIALLGRIAWAAGMLVIVTGLLLISAPWRDSLSNLTVGQAIPIVLSLKLF